MRFEIPDHLVPTLQELLEVAFTRAHGDRLTIAAHLHPEHGNVREAVEREEDLAMLVAVVCEPGRRAA